jgi:hypothetical protein
MLAQDFDWQRATHNNSLRTTRSPCNRAVFTDRSLRPSADLVVEVGSPDHRPAWQATFSRHTPQEFVAPLAETLARQLRDSSAPGPDAIQPASAKTAWPPAENWTVEVDLPRGQLHAAPTGMAGFAALNHDGDDHAGYWLFGGHGPHQWLITLTPAAPHAVVGQLYAEVADPTAVRRATRVLPHSHLRYLTITDQETPSRRLPIPSALAATIAKAAKQTGSARPVIATPGHTGGTVPPRRR